MLAWLAVASAAVQWDPTHTTNTSCAAHCALSGEVCVPYSSSFSYALCDTLETSASEAAPYIRHTTCYVPENATSFDCGALPDDAENTYRLCECTAPTPLTSTHDTTAPPATSSAQESSISSLQTSTPPSSSVSVALSSTITAGLPTESAAQGSTPPSVTSTGSSAAPTEEYPDSGSSVATTHVSTVVPSSLPASSTTPQSVHSTDEDATAATDGTAASIPTSSPDGQDATTVEFTYHEPYYLVHSDGPGVGILIFAGIFGGVIAIFTIVTVYPCTTAPSTSGDREKLLAGDNTRLVL